MPLYIPPHKRIGKLNRNLNISETLNPDLIKPSSELGCLQLYGDLDNLYDYFCNETGKDKSEVVWPSHAHMTIGLSNSYNEDFIRSVLHHFQCLRNLDITATVLNFEKHNKFIVANLEINFVSERHILNLNRDFERRNILYKSTKIQWHVTLDKFSDLNE